MQSVQECLLRINNGKAEDHMRRHEDDQHPLVWPGCCFTRMHMQLSFTSHSLSHLQKSERRESVQLNLNVWVQYQTSVCTSWLQADTDRVADTPTHLGECVKPYKVSQGGSEGFSWLSDRTMFISVTETLNQENTGINRHQSAEHLNLQLSFKCTKSPSLGWRKYFYSRGNTAALRPGTWTPQDLCAAESGTETLAADLSRPVSLEIKPLWIRLDCPAYPTDTRLDRDLGIWRHRFKTGPLVTFLNPFRSSVAGSVTLLRGHLH